MAEKTPALKPTCRDVIGLLVEYLEATLAPEVLAAFEHPLQDCAPCVAYLNTHGSRTAREPGLRLPDSVEGPARFIFTGEPFGRPRCLKDTYMDEGRARPSGGMTI